VESHRSIEPEGLLPLKMAREELDIINVYEETGSLRAAAALCGTTHRKVRRVRERRVPGQRPRRRQTPRPAAWRV
jgi:hypothetical protein